MTNADGARCRAIGVAICRNGLARIFASTRSNGPRAANNGAENPLAPLTAAIAAQPLNRENRKRTSGRTKAERRKWPTEEAAYDITVTPSNLPKADTSPGT